MADLIAILDQMRASVVVQIQWACPMMSYRTMFKRYIQKEFASEHLMMDEALFTPSARFREFLCSSRQPIRCSGSKRAMDYHPCAVVHEWYGMLGGGHGPEDIISAMSVMANVMSFLILKKRTHRGIPNSCSGSESMTVSMRVQVQRI